ncbi:hypothetical protein ACQ33O_01845 [Ferruginibacter sp. SUN002]|uniref:hypothetical protein n=1 Tax=Ferruginibacter sp. SUN002 TaxID=2937789 RepID=UPI003D36A9EB
MKHLLLLIVLFSFFLSACDNRNKKITEYISGSDSVAIKYYTGDGKMDNVVAVKIISDKKIIEQLAVMVGADAMNEVNKCGYDGSLHFFKMNQVIQDIDFRMNDVNCMQFSFIQDGKIRASSLKPEAKQLLESVRK